MKLEKSSWREIISDQFPHIMLFRCRLYYLGCFHDRVVVYMFNTTYFCNNQSSSFLGKLNQYHMPSRKLTVIIYSRYFVSVYSLYVLIHHSTFRHQSALPVIVTTVMLFKHKRIKISLTLRMRWHDNIRRYLTF